MVLCNPLNFVNLLGLSGNLRAAAQCRRPLRWGPAQVFFCFGSGFWLVQACWLAGLLARLIVCLFSALFQAALVCPHSEHQPKERYMESRQLSVPRARPARTASRPARLEAALASPQRARTKGVRRQPAPPLESYRSPGRDQQEQLRVQRAWRPHLLRRSEHEPKECAGSLLRRGRVPNVAFEWPLFAVGKRARPGKALKHLQGTVFSAEALSRPARPAFLLPSCCRRTPLVGSRCGQRSASSLPFCCRRTPLVSFLFLSAAGASAGSEAFVAGRSLWPFSAESYAQQVFEHSRPAQLRGSWCSGITPAQHATGAGFNPRPVHAPVRLRLSQFASPWSFIPLGLLCVLPRPAGTPRPGAKRHF